MTATVPNRFDGYVGLPWCDKGRDIAGVDCYGLLRLVYRELRGIELASYVEDYPSAADRAATAALISGELDGGVWHQINDGTETIYDAVLITEARLPRHIGLVTEPGRMLHIDRGSSSVIERYRTGIYAHRIAGLFRFKAAA